jgi:hypothetical protein
VLLQHGLFTTVHKYHSTEDWVKFAEENPDCLKNIGTLWNVLLEYCLLTINGGQWDKNSGNWENYEIQSQHLWNTSQQFLTDRLTSDRLYVCVLLEYYPLKIYYWFHHFQPFIIHCWMKASPILFHSHLSWSASRWLHTFFSISQPIVH